MNTFSPVSRQPPPSESPSESPSRCALVLAAVSTSAQRDGDSDGDSDGGGWRLTGEKVFIHNAPVADFAVVLARTDPEAGRAGLTVFLVDLDSPGIERTYRERKTAQ